MISQKAKYAFKALLHLARQEKGETVQIDDIARQRGCRASSSNISCSISSIAA